MREIKYKVWHIEHKEWIHDTWNIYIDPDGEVYEIEERSWAMQFYMDRENITEKVIVVWCTGLKDKNGKEIYESDVVDQNGIRCIIQSCISGFDCKMINDVFHGTTFTFDWLHSDYCEIIGNRFENPELLEGA